jgi:predicted ATPase
VATGGYVITEFRAQIYGPLKDVRCALTPLHAFIGPNDSGKSTLLRGIVTLVNIAAGQPLRHFFSNTTPELSMVVSREARFQLFRNGTAGWVVQPTKNAAWVSGGAKVCRFEADALRAPSSLTPPGQRWDWIDRRGLGLPGALDILLRRNDGSFQEIAKQFTNLFPTVRRLQLPNISATQTQVSAVLHDGTEILPAAMSEGMLYYLAYATLQRLGGAAVLAVEEPETGLHPARIAEIMRVLRALSESGTQVVIATHSPLVVNELHAGEVSVVTRTLEAGTKVKLISETPNFDKRSKVYALGELWLSYANGTDEAPLLEGTARETSEE